MQNRRMKQFYDYYYYYYHYSTALVVLLLLVFQLAAVVQSYQQPNSGKVNHHRQDRRAFLITPFVAVVATAQSQAPVAAAWALDMDAFINQELTKDSVKPILGKDEALCRFGQPSQATGEACLRAGLSTKRRGSGGTLDAFGNVDRGDFVRCQFVYELNGKGGYEKITVCSDGSKNDNDSNK